MILIASFVAGIALGLRFKLLILLPGFIVIGVAGLVWSDAVTTLLSLCVLQVGYLGGAFSRHVHRRARDRGVFHRRLVS